MVCARSQRESRLVGPVRCVNELVQVSFHMRSHNFGGDPDSEDPEICQITGRTRALLHRRMRRDGVLTTRLRAPSSIVNAQMPLARRRTLQIMTGIPFRDSAVSPYLTLGSIPSLTSLSSRYLHLIASEKTIYKPSQFNECS